MKRAKSGWLPGWILITLFAFPLPARCQEMSRDTLIWHANDYFNKSFNQARRNSDLAQIYADSSKMLYEAADEPYGVMRYDYLMGVIERFRGNFPKAKEHLNEFLVAAIDKKDTLKMADTHFQLGTILQNQGLLDEAIEHGYASIRLYEAAGYPQYTADSYTNLGIIYRKLKQYDSAEQQYRRALEIDEELNDLDGQAGNNANLGNLFAEQSRYEEAIQCYRRAMRFDSLNQSLWGLTTRISATCTTIRVISGKGLTSIFGRWVSGGSCPTKERSRSATKILATLILNCYNMTAPSSTWIRQLR